MATLHTCARMGSGNLMSLYSSGDTINAGRLTQNEVGIYGSSRLGLLKPNIDVTLNVTMPGVGSKYFTTFTRGQKIFELSNHLGDVMVNLTDKKLGIRSTSDTTKFSYYSADIISANDYYPGGMVLPERSYTAGNSYRYGFNGQEKSSELNDNLYTAEYWEYDSRIGRRWNLDPKPTIGISLYSTFSGNPILFSDPLGDSGIVNNRGNKIHYDPKDKDKRIFMQQDGKLTPIGSLGGKIDAKKIIGNILADNKKEVLSQNFPFMNWLEKVFKGGDWDYANNENTIFGIAQQDQKENGGSMTEFNYKDYHFEPHDFGNYNAGYTGTYSRISPAVQYEFAGTGEIAKNFFKLRWGSMHPSQLVSMPMGGSRFGSITVMTIPTPPFGDSPKGYRYNTDGMNDAAAEMAKNPAVPILRTSVSIKDNTYVAPLFKPFK